MSSYIAVTKHPKTGKWENAQWIDDYYGPHKYGVKFEDGDVFDPGTSSRANLEISETEKPVNPEFGWPLSHVNPSDTPSQCSHCGQMKLGGELDMRSGEYTCEDCLTRSTGMQNTPDKESVSLPGSKQAVIPKSNSSIVADDELDNLLVELGLAVNPTTFATSKAILQAFIDQRVGEARTNGQSSVLTKIIPWVKMYHPEIVVEMQVMISEIAALTKATKGKTE